MAAQIAAKLLYHGADRSVDIFCADVSGVTANSESGQGAAGRTDRVGKAFRTDPSVTVAQGEADLAPSIPRPTSPT